jgi:c(7)-type cytochrome triheme protein
LISHIPKGSSKERLLFQPPVGEKDFLISKGGQRMKKMGLGILLFLLIAPLVSAKVGGGEITFKVKKEGNVIFSHDIHVGAMGLKCTDCHDDPFVTKEKHKPVTMAQMQKGQSCGACHNGKKAFEVKAKTNCNNCHKK